ncbi:CDP-glycerol glycerophosphotransferase family protein [uncultured Microbacterium sp.]|uniref:Putative glycosyl/glycerophosphate transferase n=1 Tax=uncultured Microbacterium sp. TaxID=191216 RepID=A0A1Y5NZ28_9MICO|nr:CDP-glycerol glycerophosphotransferase family protein [uncultured Microbacterium sp.]SBS70349.1 putative glycosyl/glycerophosphate transferase [uncultured Microbacterium sp.]
MASFSFGAGNAGKLVRIPLYLLGRLATFLIPRSRDEWVFGCAVGVADGALALWDRAAFAGEDAVWLTGGDRDAAAAEARGIPHVPKHSARGFWRTARARVVVVTHGLGDVNRYAVAGAFVVQLWHGIPLKRIGLDSPETTRSPLPIGSAAVSRLLALLYRRAQRGIRVLPAASELVRGRLESAFGLDHERVPVTGEPRVDVLSRGTAEERRAAARTRLDDLVGPFGAASRLVLYAPTWRDGAPDPAVPTAAQWARLTEVLTAGDGVLLIRSHPLGAGDYTPPAATDRVRLLASDLVADVTPLLPGLDALVTDYSSLAFDAALVPLPCLFLAPDVDAYRARRGFYGTYAELAGDEVAPSWTEATAQLEQLWADPHEHARRRDRAEALSARMHAHRDGRNTERVYEAVRAGLARGRTT